MEPLLVDVYRAAELLGVGVRTIHKLRHDPSFPRAISLGARATRFRTAELVAWADGQPRIEGRAEPAELARARDARRSAGGTAGGVGGGSKTPGGANPRWARGSASGPDFEPPSGSISDPQSTPRQCAGA
jgi:predicted DNA-binding transcriptional regulator AlpA